MTDEDYKLHPMILAVVGDLRYRPSDFPGPNAIANCDKANAALVETLGYLSSKLRSIALAHDFLKARNPVFGGMDAKGFVKSLVDSGVTYQDAWSEIHAIVARIYG